jgi:3-oxosteroid 1-dehydrogenase
MDETFDFVVVGSGGGSMCAGLVMRKAGKDVLILEKTDLVGGSTARAGGVLWVPNNRFMKAEGVDDSYEKATAYLDAVVGDNEDTPGATRERRQAYIRQAPEMIDFLVGQGIKMRRVPYWPDYYDDRAGGSEPGRTVMAELFNVNELGPWKSKLRESFMPIAAPMEEMMKLPLLKVSWRSKYFAMKAGLRMISDKLAGREMAGAGRALQGRMLQAAVKAGVDIRTHSPVKDLIVEDGAVVGVVTVKDGKPWRVGARQGVLLNAGGFAHNQAMRDQYIPHTRAEWTHAAPGDTGDMHQLLMKMGAAMAQMEEMVGNQCTLPPGEDLPAGVQMELAKPHAFLVDQTGERYMNEGGSYMAFCKGMLERHQKVPAVHSWMIMDRQFMRNYMLGGHMPGESKPPSWLQEGYLHRADTIEGLAKAIGVDPASLKATTDRFNSFARQGKDEDFRRGERAYDRFLGDTTHNDASATLGAVEQGPFYAVAVYPGDVGTYGGVVTDAYARVLMKDGSVLQGLYATGTTTAGVMGRTYPGAGCSIGPSFTWGYVAAKHAAGIGNQPA